MCDRCGNNRRNVVPVTNVPNSMRIAAPVTAVEAEPLETNVQGILYINRRLKPFGFDNNLNSIALALYIFISFFIIVAMILFFFSLRSHSS